MVVTLMHDSDPYVYDDDIGWWWHGGDGRTYVTTKMNYGSDSEVYYVFVAVWYGG